MLSSVSTNFRDFAVKFRLDESAKVYLCNRNRILVIPQVVDIVLLDSSLIDGYSTPAAKVSLDFGLEVDQCTFLEGNVSVLPPVYVIGPLRQCALQ